MTALRTLCLFAASLASCAAPQFSLTPSLANFEPEGDLSYLDLTLPAPASSHNTIDDLGLAEGESTFGVRADLKFGSPHLTLSTQASSWEGNGVLNGDFGGISGSTAVDTELELALHRFALTFDLIPGDTLDLGLGFGVSVADLEAQVTETGTANTESADEVAPIPVLALRGAVRWWRLELGALVSGMTVSFEDTDATYLEADLSARLTLLGAPGSLSGSLVLGWRQIDLDVEYSNDDEAAALDLTFSGPYLGLQLGL